MKTNYIRILFIILALPFFVGCTKTVSPAQEKPLDGEVRTYEINRKYNPVNLIITGDGFIEEDFAAGGAFDRAVKEGVEALFAVEPYKTYREYFNIYKVVAVSKERGASHSDRNIIRNTAFGTSYNGGSAMTTDDDKVFAYAAKISGIASDQTTVILIVNDSRYGGTTMMYSTGRTIAICPMNRANVLPGGFAHILVHEAGGHGFGLLADEYTNDNPEPPTSDEIADMKLWFGFRAGFYKNVDLTDNLSQIKWADFVGRSGYEAVGAYEGAFYYEKGVWRPEYISCMDDNRFYFNTPSRAAIVRRILSKAGETYTLEKFIAKDVQKSMPVSMGTKSAVSVEMPRLAPPVRIYDR